MDTVGIVIAMPMEARALKHGLPARQVAQLDSDVLVCVCGIGAANARRAAHELLGSGAGALVSWGTAGGLVASLQPGALILPASVVGPDAAYETDAVWSARLHDRLAPQIGVSAKPIYSGDALIESVQAKQKLADDTGAVAVDMESLAVGAAAAASNTPFVCVRVVADPLTSELPAALGAAIDTDGFINTSRLFGLLVRRPGDVLPLLQVARHFRSAASTLRRVAATTGPRLLAP